jgi:hypothetical protein
MVISKIRPGSGKVNGSEPCWTKKLFANSNSHYRWMVSAAASSTTVPGAVTGTASTQLPAKTPQRACVTRTIVITTIKQPRITACCRTAAAERSTERPCPIIPISWTATSRQGVGRARAGEQGHATLFARSFIRGLPHARRPLGFL